MSDEPITRFTSAGGARVYRMPLQVFPSLRAYAHLVIAGDYVALIDVGSGQGPSNDQLRTGFTALSEEWGEQVNWSDLDRIVITHAHIDHHGGLNMVRQLTSAPIAIHELDRRVLINYEERLAMSRFKLSVFLRHAGLSDEHRTQLLAMYGNSKDRFQSLPVEDILKDGDQLDQIFRVIHVPGHCPGQVCLQLDDLLLTADHVLPGVAVFLSPEALTASTGVDHYLQSLRKVATLTGVRLALGGHGRPVHDLGAAIKRIEATQEQRIARIYEACNEPHSIAELTALLYPDISNYDELLALQKVGAYIEYLDQRGMLAIDNLSEVAADEEGVPRYRAV